MAIGTSLGAYFESPFHQEAGIETPPDTGDDNVLPPDSETQSNPPKEAKVIPVSDRFSKVKILTPDVLQGAEDRASQYFQDLVHAPYITQMRNPRNDNKEDLLSKTPEAIKSPALRIKGELYEGQSHGLALNDFQAKLTPEQFKDEATYKGFEEGFTTTHGRFIDRDEALKMALERDQIKDEVLPALTPDSTMLLSEDLK